MAAADPQTQRAPIVVFLWDGSHLGNFADADARSQRGCEWVNEIKEAVTRMTKRHVTGKGQEILLETVDKPESVALGPKLWPSTRLTQQNANTFNDRDRRRRRLDRGRPCPS